MTKRRSNFSLFSRGGLLFIVLLTVAVPGCKQKTPPPPPQVMPLPKKAQPPTVAPAVATAKPLQAAPSSARTTVVKSPVQSQMTSSKRPTQGGSIAIDFASRRDPFRPFVQMPSPQQSASGKGAKIRVRDPLPIQSFDTEKFKISGIVTGLKENSALVIDPNGKGYVVKEGMQIGSNDGYVKRVTNSTVEVEESFRDDSGKVRKRVVKLTLIRKK